MMIVDDDDDLSNFMSQIFRKIINEICIIKLKCAYIVYIGFNVKKLLSS